MGLNIAAVLAEVTSAAKSLGKYDVVAQGELKRKPTGNGIWAAVWPDRIAPQGRASGLDRASAVMTFVLRSYTNALNEPIDQIDPRIISAVDAMVAALLGGFTLGANVREVDVFGIYGTSLTVEAGYIDVDSTKFRVVDLTIPLVVNDVWTLTE